MRFALLLATLAAAALPPNWHDAVLRHERATENDFSVFEKGLADSEKVSPALFPRGLGPVDAILYDTDDLYIYSKSLSYPLPKFRRRGAYQVYRVPLGHPAEEHEMAICMGGSGPASVEVKRTITERSYACAPWSSFGRIQKERGSDYRFVEGYWASMIHELGHIYRDRLSADPTPEMGEIDRRIASMKLPAGTDAARAADEGYATWCELKASKTLYPEHFRRLMKRAVRADRGDDEDGHEAGLRAAARLIRSSRMP